MDLNKTIKAHVQKSYRIDNINCATTMLTLLRTVCDISLDKQVIQAAAGMHGAGRYGAQCGLVEGTLMFIGIFGASLGWEKSTIIETCYEFAKGFDKSFGSLSCHILRPEGFKEEQPPHLCMDLTIQAGIYTINFLNSKKIAVSDSVIYY